MTDEESTDKSQETGFSVDHIEGMSILLRSTQSCCTLLYILGLCGIYRTGVFEGNEAAFRNGERNIGLQIINLIHAVDPQAYPKFLIKMHEEEANRMAAKGKTNAHVAE